MVKAVFADSIVRNLCTYFERKVVPTPEAIDMWFRRVEKIPDESVSWIVQRIKENHEGFPKNLPNTIWDHFREWISAHPEKVAFTRSQVCKKCNGSGYIFALRFDAQGHFFQYVFRCPACEQATETGIPIWNAGVYPKDGFKIIPEQDKPLTKKTIEEMVESICKKNIQ